MRLVVATLPNDCNPCLVIDPKEVKMNESILCEQKTHQRLSEVQHLFLCRWYLYLTTCTFPCLSPP